jgi:ankyrin repeat protein
MHIRRAFVSSAILCLLAGVPAAIANDLADAAMLGEQETVRSLLEQKAAETGPGGDSPVFLEYVNAPQVDGTTALHWAVHWNDIEMARLLIGSGADVSGANRAGATPMRLASINGNATMIETLLDAGADASAPLTKDGDTPLMMAARTGAPDAVQILLDRGAAIDARETWAGTTALMWAISEHHPEVAATLIDRGAGLEIRSKVVAVANSRGVEGTVPVEAEPDAESVGYANGGFTPLMFAAREGQIETARRLVEAGADVNTIAADGKNALGMAIYNGHFELASLLVDSGTDVNHADAEGFPPLFWAVDRRNMEWSPGFPWVETTDPLPLTRQLLEAGADPNTFVNNTPRSRRNFGGSPRTLFATSLMRAAYSGDVELVRLLIGYGADPFVRNSENEDALLAASGYAWIDGYSQGRSTEERLETMQLLVELGADVNWACNHGITPLMMAANFGEVELIQYLADQGADLGAHDLGKKNDGVFGGSIEPLMPIDYAIGVGSFRPNNAVLHMDEATALMRQMMEERGIPHTTSECTLRAFSCGSVDPQGSTPAEIAITRSIQLGNQVEGITGGLEVEGAGTDPDGGVGDATRDPE